MESLAPEVLGLLFVAAALAGFVDSIAGGGGLIALPALLWSGLSPVQALGTNKLQGSFGTLTAAYRFWRAGLVQPGAMLPSIGFTLLGAVGGTVLVQTMDSALLADFIPWLLIGFALYFLLSPRVSDADAQERIGQPAFALFIGTSVGFYDGFFGPGTGSFFAAAYVALLGYNLRRATAHTKILNFTSNLASLTAFTIGGSVVWTLGLVMACGQFAGAWIGAHMVLTRGSRIIRPLLVAVSLAVSIKLLLGR